MKRSDPYPENIEIVELTGRPGFRDQMVEIPTGTKVIRHGPYGHWRVVPRRCEYHRPLFARAVWVPAQASQAVAA